MTTKKALQIIDHVIQKKSQLKADFLNLEMPWNQGEGKIPEFSQQLAQSEVVRICTLCIFNKLLWIFFKCPTTTCTTKSVFFAIMD